MMPASQIAEVENEIGGMITDCVEASFSSKMHHISIIPNLYVMIRAWGKTSANKSLGHGSVCIYHFILGYFHIMYRNFSALW